MDVRDIVLATKRKKVLVEEVKERVQSGNRTRRSRPRANSVPRKRSASREKKPQKKVIIKEEVVEVKKNHNVVSTRFHPRMNRPPLGRGQDSVSSSFAKAIVKQCIDPQSVTQPIRYPDGKGDKVAICKNWQVIASTGLTFGSITYQSIIHTGKITAQYLYNTNTLPLSCGFTIANLALNSEAGTLVDNIQSSASYAINSVFAAGASVMIPLRTGVTIAGTTGTVALLQASEIYDNTGALATTANPVYSFYASNGGPIAMSLAPGDLVEIKMNYSSTIAGTVGTSISLGTGATVTTTVLNSTTSVAGGITNLYGRYTVTTADRFMGMQIASTNEIHVSSIIVQVITSGNPYVGASGFNIPYGRYVGQQVKSYSILQVAAEAERTIASAILYTDLSAMLTVAGSLTVSQIYSGTTPCEAQCAGYTAATNFPGSIVPPESKGAYSAPFKIPDIRSANFYDLDNVWQGIQPYTVTYVKIPSSVNLIFRATVCDIIEFKSAGQQVFSLTTQEERASIIGMLQHMFKEKQVISENPLHLGMIARFLANAATVIPKYLPVAKQAFEDFSNF